MNFELEALLERIYNEGNSQGFVVSFAEWISVSGRREYLMSELKRLVNDGEERD